MGPKHCGRQSATNPTADVPFRSWAPRPRKSKGRAPITGLAGYAHLLPRAPPAEPTTADADAAEAAQEEEEEVEEEEEAKEEEEPAPAPAPTPTLRALCRRAARRWDSVPSPAPNPHFYYTPLAETVEEDLAELRREREQVPQATWEGTMDLRVKRRADTPLEELEKLERSVKRMRLE